MFSYPHAYACVIYIHTYIHTKRHLKPSHDLNKESKTYILILRSVGNTEKKNEPYCCVTAPLRLPATTYYVPTKMDAVVTNKEIFVDNTYYHNIDGGHES